MPSSKLSSIRLVKGRNRLDAVSVMSRLSLRLLCIGLLFLAACAGESATETAQETPVSSTAAPVESSTTVASAEVGAEDPDTADTTTSAPADPTTTAPPAADDAAVTTTEAVVTTTTAEPATTTTESQVDENLVWLVGGGQLDLNSIEGTDTVLWFWAPW